MTTDLDREVPEGRRKIRPTRVIVVLPAYNEELNIGSLLCKIDEAMVEERMPYDVLVVDDGSKDQTVGVLESYRNQLPLSIHRHEVNQGLGATIRDGLREGAKMASDGDIVIAMDADETHSPGLMMRMVRMIREGHDVVIASRYQPGARVYGLTMFRRIMSSGASILCRTIFPTPGVKDYTCGFRAYRASVLKRAFETYGDKFVDAEGFQCMLDILLKLRAMNVVFGEVPMILRYDLKQGQSKMKVARTVRQSLTLMFRRRLGL
jgi:dolichol-phosphate mannosyltransferase